MSFKIFKKFYKSDPIRQIRHLLLTVFLLDFIAVIIILPRKVGLMVGKVLGLGTCFLATAYKERVDSNLKKAFPGKSPSQIRYLRIETYKNIGMNLVDFALLNFRSKEYWFKRIEIKNEKYLREAIQKGKGVLYVTAHTGNWELMAAYLTMKGYPLNVIAREIYDKRLNSLLVNLRKKRGVKTIYRTGRGNTRRMLSALKRGEILGVLIDQDTKVGGVFVNFFGRLAHTPTAVSQFARSGNTVVIPGFIYRKEDYSHTIKLQPPRKAGKDVKKETQEFTKIIEDFIRRHPTQWVWMHPRWKTRPV
ncbi:MAG: lysophospholipid acyltransferase family protein [Elusimicrobiota bacterium]